VIALTSSPHRHDRSVTGVLIQTFHDDLAEMKELLCGSGSTSDMFLEKICLKGLAVHAAKKFDLNNTFQNLLRFMNVSYVVSVANPCVECIAIDATWWNNV